MEWISHSAEETSHIGYLIGKELTSNNVVCLFGELGAGKTTFIKGVRAAFADTNSLEQVNSPTFVYLNIYKGSKTLYHFDLYRLRDAEEFLSMGFDEYFFADGVCCIEWSERIETLLPRDSIRITLAHVGENTRVITKA